MLLAVLVGGVAVGRVAGPPPQEARGAPGPLRLADTTPAPSTVVAAQRAELPARDVPGADLDRLPRYARSVRVFFDRAQGVHGTVTSAEYLARASRDQVRSFYRDVFNVQGWTVADMSFTYDQWRFLVVREDGSEASVELRQRAGLVEIDLQLTRPATGRPSASPTPASVVAPPPVVRPPVVAPPVVAPPPAPPHAEPPPDDDSWEPLESQDDD
jgi:hypothetical protein